MTAAVPVAARRVGDALRAKGAARSRVAWPSPMWKGRHIEFARDVLGMRTLARHQVEILHEYYQRERVEGVVCTGQKLGKTEIEIVAALADFATEPALNGFVFGPKIDHTNEVFWPRFAGMAIAAYLPCAKCIADHRWWCGLVDDDPLDRTPRPDRCSSCSSLIPSELRDHARPEKGRESAWLDDKNSEGGLRAPDGRIIRGYASRKIGGKGGLSGCVRFYLDESSDIDDATREAIAGNMSGGGKLLAFGNMLHRSGWFYRAFKTERDRYTFAYQKSSRESPNCPGRIVWSDGVITVNQTGDRPVRGMANPEGIEANLRAWRGTDLIAARIDAVPPQIIEGQLTPSSVVTEAEARWSQASDDDPGVLQFGVDVARSRDPLVIAVRRGRKILDIIPEVLHEADHAKGVERLMDVVRAHRRPHERKPRVVYDATGHEGHRFGMELRRHAGEVDIVAIQMAHPPRNRRLYDKRRDELAHGFSTWLRSGGAIPTSAMLEAEIDVTTAERVEVSYGQSGAKWEVLRVVDNDTLRKTLGHSPDERNACELAVLDIDGDEMSAEVPAAPQIPTSSGTSPAIQAAPPPADDVQGSVFSQQDALYGAIWGHR